MRVFIIASAFGGAGAVLLASGSWRLGVLGILLWCVGGGIIVNSQLFTQFARRNAQAIWKAAIVRHVFRRWL